MSLSLKNASPSDQQRQQNHHFFLQKLHVSLAFLLYNNRQQSALFLPASMKNLQQHESIRSTVWQFASPEFLWIFGRISPLRH